jgi:hypothetical protein
MAQSKLHAEGAPRGTRLMRDSGRSKPGRVYKPPVRRLTLQPARAKVARFGGSELCERLSDAAGIDTEHQSMPNYRSSYVTPSIERNISAPADA